MADRERDDLAAGGVIGGGAALQVIAAVHQQGNAVLGADRHIGHHETRLVQPCSHVADNGLGQVHRKAHRLVLGGPVAERDGRFAVGHGDPVRFKDLVQGLRLDEGRHGRQTGDEQRGRLQIHGFHVISFRQATRTRHH
ncbi:hypothetical protein D3C72_2060700 [compost metagenome]